MIENPNEFYNYKFKRCDKTCEDCIYRGTFSGAGGVRLQYICEYLRDTHHLRPCPAGKKCTVKVAGNMKNKFGCKQILDIYEDADVKKLV